jgi:hypothetical protein
MNRIHTVEGRPRNGTQAHAAGRAGGRKLPDLQRRYPVSGPPENGPSGESNNGRSAEGKN